MSADPFIQAPGSLQSHNRYAYVMNNPLNLTDPSGYFSFRSVFRAVFRIVAPLLSILPQNIASIAVNALSLYCGPAAPVCAGAGQAALAYYHGASGSDALRTGLRAGATAYLFQQAGGVGQPDELSRYAAHAGAGCISSVANGENCGRGALSAIAGKYATNATSGWGDSIHADIGRFVVAVTAGGVSSVIAGGKFANGAETAAYGYLFNHLMSVGANIRVPLVGGAKFAVGVSYENGKWDAGVIIDSDIPTLGAGKYIARATADVSYQTGDFESNHGAMSQNLQVGAKSVGVSIQRGPEGVNGAGISLGPQLGVQVSAQQSRTVSVRSDVVPAVNRAIDRVKSWFGN